MVPVGRRCVWASLSGWVCPVLTFLELGVSPPQLLAGLSDAECRMSRLQGTLWLGSALRDNGGVFFQVLKPNRYGHRVEEVAKPAGSAAFLAGGVADTGYTMARLLPAALGHLRTLRKRAASKFSLVTHTYNPSTWEEENRESGVQGQPGLRETVTKK